MEMTQFDKRNISMMMDFYELTMSNGYFQENSENTKVVFDLFYRRNPDKGGFAVFAGLEQIIEYIENLHFSDHDISYLRSLSVFPEKFLEYLKNFKFTGDVYSFDEGTVIYPNEPVITVIAPLIEAQLIETVLLTQINHQTLIATKACRIVRAAKGRPVSDMGARRAHNIDAAVYGARAAYIGGVENTATVLAGQLFNIPVIGTMAHSWIMFYDNEFDAFRRYAEIYGNSTVLLVDTYDTINSGIPNAIRIANEILIPKGQRLRGVRIDSGDIAYLSKKARKMLDAAGLSDCKIIGSNSLDEQTITSILLQGGCIDNFGVGERLITAHSDSTFGAVYKLVAIEDGGVYHPKIKLSENIEKITNPGIKRVYRVYNNNGQAIADLITNEDEVIDQSKPYRYISPAKPWQERYFKNCRFKELKKQIISNGKRISEKRSLKEIRDFVKYQLENEIWEEEQRFENPHTHYLDMSPDYYNMKMNLLQSHKSE